LSYYVSGLERHYLVGDEIAIYGDTEDLVEKIKYYLVNDDIRETIATAGYQRTLLDHTFNKNFNNVFNKMGLIDVR
jgi:spore maturation protein CgeB